MPEAERAASAPNQNLVAELKVSGHLMNFDPGLFCILQTPGKNVDVANGLPGVRVSLPPGPSGRGDLVTIKTFRDDGWLFGTGDAALVRVVGGAAQVLVTVYQAPNGRDTAPNLQVLRLLEGDAVQGQAPAMGAMARPMIPAAAGPQQIAAQQAAMQQAAMQGGEQVKMDLMAHIQSVGDVGGKLGDWLGQRGSRCWIEGFAIAPTKYITSADIEYQAVLGRGWSSPWVEGGEFCGSRGMALPVLGVRIRLKGAAADKFECHYTASFVDGTLVGPVAAGEACEAESLAAIEAFQVIVHPVGEPPVAESGDDTPGGAARGKSAVRGKAADEPVKAEGDRKRGKAAAELPTPAPAAPARGAPKRR